MNLQQLADTVGAVFLAGTAAFAIGVIIPGAAGMDRSVFGTASTQKYLEIIGSNPRAWRKSAAWLGSGTLLNVLGVGLLASLHYGTSGQWLAEAARLTFVSGALFMILGLGFRMAVDPLVADLFAKASKVPAWFEAMQAWNMAVGMIYMALGYIAIAMLGASLLQSGLLAAWIGWLSLVFGISGALSIITNSPHYPGTDYSIAAVPFWLHIMPLVVGVALLLQV
jgi:hypothetical protein